MLQQSETKRRGGNTPGILRCKTQHASSEGDTYFRAMEHLKPVGQSESGHERTVWSLSCLKR